MADIDPTILDQLLKSDDPKIKALLERGLKRLEKETGKSSSKEAQAVGDAFAKEILKCVNAYVDQELNKKVLQDPKIEGVRVVLTVQLGPNYKAEITTRGKRGSTARGEGGGEAFVRKQALPEGTEWMVTSGGEALDQGTVKGGQLLSDSGTVFSSQTKACVAALEEAGKSTTCGRHPLWVKLPGHEKFVKAESVS